MKFLEFVSCCGPALTPSGPTVRPEPARRPEETRSLVQPPPPPRSRRRRKRGWLGASGSVSASAEWRPSLCSISEDNVVVIEKKGEENNRTAGSERMVKRKSGSRSPRRTNGVSYSDDYGRSSFPTVIPAFSPTPFMF
ncbi:hypothetical protein PanWU01x14_185680 [Parasponia andersonii]|uniref:Uncharacterized protein n=1 Tax=Parasponia andersonii TaxID=3476 RepID=A0A2P5C424_PARAD|nr:hypothetical protein PanWU01x14_185680 [Parasponia andersonii]